MKVDGFFTRLNPLVATILRSPAHWPLSIGLLLLSFTGRKSGRQAIDDILRFQFDLLGCNILKFLIR